MKKSLFALSLAVAIAAAVPWGANADHTGLHTTQQIRAQIAALQAKLAVLLKEQETSPAWCHTFNKNLKLGDRGDEINALKTALRLQDFEIENFFSGDASFFDEQVASAAVGFQQKYSDEILKPAGLSYGTGFVGRFTRAKLNALYGCKKPVPPPASPNATQGTAPPPALLPPPPPATIVPTVKVFPSSTQPAATLAVRGAIVPFTNVTISPESPVFLKELVVERTGLGNNSAFSEVVLIANPSAGVDANNNDRMVAHGKIDPATRKAVLLPMPGFGLINGLAEFTVAGVMASDLSSYAGQASSLSITDMKFVAEPGGFDTAVPDASFPIRGTGQTIDNSLAIGELSVKTVNDINSGGRMDFRASAAEDVRLYKIILRSAGGSILIEAVPYNCAAMDIYEMCDLGTGVTIPKGTAVKVTPKSAGFAAPSAYDITAYGKAHGYRLMPVILASAAGSAQNQNLASVLAGFRAQLELLSKVLQSLMPNR